jgi:hypothetical protein
MFACFFCTREIGDVAQQAKRLNNKYLCYRRPGKSGTGLDAMNLPAKTVSERGFSESGCRNKNDGVSPTLSNFSVRASLPIGTSLRSIQRVSRVDLSPMRKKHWGPTAWKFRSCIDYRDHCKMMNFENS